MVALTAMKCPTDDLVYSNCAVVNSADMDAGRIKHVEIQTAPVHRYVMTIRNHPSVPRGKIAFGMAQRKWAQISLDQQLDVTPIQLDPNRQYIGGITLEADFQSKKSVTSDALDSDAMAREFSMQFGGQAFTTGMLLVFGYKQGDAQRVLSLSVKSMEALDLASVAGGGAEGGKKDKLMIDCGQLLPNSAVIFDKADGSQMNLIGKSKGKAAFRSIINPDWDFQKMGIGGLDNEFSAIFRRAFASRVFPPEFIEQLAMKHVRGILLFGPPGTGKTLIARQIGKMLNAREPKIINGPQILDKYVGESEAKIRALFADAEEEAKRCGANSGLHIIIFDEIDAICKARGSMGSSSAVHDTVVNQLLSKMDGVEQLNNILVIGMTNRRDMIDDALLRPGRLEVHTEIGLPDEPGRVQILRIHTARMREYGKLGADVNLDELAKLSRNFSGAEIEGLVRAAQSSAMNRLVKAGGKVEIDPNAVENMAVLRGDFMHALENDIKPAFGSADDVLERFIGTGVIEWGPSVSSVLAEGLSRIKQAAGPDARSMVSVLLEGGPGSGTTALAAHIAKQSEFPYVKVLSPEDMVGFNELAKVQRIRKMFDDAYKSPLSVVLIDDIERLIDYTPIGPRFSNQMLQAILVLAKMQPTNKKCRLLVLATTGNRELIEEMGITASFSTVLHVSPLTKGEHILAAIDKMANFNDDEMMALQRQLTGKKCLIGIKKLLGLIELADCSEPSKRVTTLLCHLEEEGGLDMIRQ